MAVVATLVAREEFRSSAGTSSPTTPFALEPLHALGLSDSDDSDVDGLPDLYELVLKSHVDASDTDLDSFCDLEELARGTNIHAPDEHPEAIDRVAVELTACVKNFTVRVGSAIFVGDGQINDYSIRLGLSSRGRVGYLHPALVAANSETHHVRREEIGSGPGAQPMARLVFVDTELDRALFPPNTHVAVFLYLVHLPSGKAVSADVLDLFVFPDGQVAMQEESDRLPWPVPTGGGGSLTGATSVYLPLGGGSGPNSMPPTWSSARICVTSSQQVGAGAGVVTMEVVDANCVVVYEGSCPGSCPGRVGSTYQTIDPLFLTN